MHVPTVISLFSRPWVQAPVMGTRQNSSGCAETEAFSVLDVITDLNVLEVGRFLNKNIKTSEQEH